MTWVKLDDGFGEHEKVVGLSDRAFRLYVVTLCYSARRLSDGRVPAPIVKGEKKAAGELVRAGLWEQNGSGWIIHDFLEFNPSKDVVTHKRRTNAARMRDVRSHKPSTFADSAEEVRSTPAPAPTPSPLEPESFASEDAPLELTDEEWEAYRVALDIAPDPEPVTHAGGLNDQQRYLLGRLHEHDKGWRKVTFGGLNKLKAAHTSAIVTYALQRAWESKLVPAGSAYGLLATICESVAKEQGGVGA